MRIHIIACRVLSRELSYYASQSPHMVDISWLPQGLHDTPDTLRASVQRTVRTLREDVDNCVLKHKPDAICLGYGLCSNGVIGLESGDIPLIVPRTDDCIALFLGSQARYLSLFETYPGTFWLNNGWIESCYGTMAESDGQREELRAFYIAQYGEDNADFLMEQDALWVRNYRYLTFIDSEVFHNPAYVDIARQRAERNAWQLRTEQGDDRMLRMMTRGEWNDVDFCICPPFHRIEAAYDGTKMRAVPLAEGHATQEESA